MTLPATGSISAFQIQVEDQRTLLSPIDFNQTSLRKLSNVTTDQSQISFDDFHGKTFGVGNGYNQSTFTNAAGLNPSTVTTSNTITITDVGVEPVIFLLQSTDPDAKFSLNGEPLVGVNVLSSMKNGDTLSITATSNVWNRKIVSTIVCTAGAAKSFTMTTRAYGYFTTSFTSAADVVPSTVMTSNAISVSDVGETPVAVAAADATATINGIAMSLDTGTVTVADGDVVQVTVSAPSTTSSSVSVTVGSSSYTVTTVDTKFIYIVVQHRVYASSAGPMYYQGSVNASVLPNGLAGIPSGYTSSPVTVTAGRVTFNGDNAVLGGPTLYKYYHMEMYSTEGNGFTSMYDNSDASGVPAGTTITMNFTSLGVRYNAGVCEGLAGAAYLRV